MAMNNPAMGLAIPHCMLCDDEGGLDKVGFMLVVGFKRLHPSLHIWSTYGYNASDDFVLCSILWLCTQVVRMDLKDLEKKKSCCTKCFDILSTLTLWYFCFFGDFLCFSGLHGWANQGRNRDLAAVIALLWPFCGFAKFRTCPKQPKLVLPRRRGGGAVQSH